MNVLSLTNATSPPPAECAKTYQFRRGKREYTLAPATTVAFFEGLLASLILKHSGLSVPAFSPPALLLPPCCNAGTRCAACPLALCLAPRSGAEHRSSRPSCRCPVLPASHSVAGQSTSGARCQTLSHAAAWSASPARGTPAGS